MADLAITEDNVVVTWESEQQRSRLLIAGILGETIDRGMPMYLDASVTPNKWMKAQCDGSLAQSVVAGYSLGEGVINQSIGILRNPDPGEYVRVNLGASTPIQGAEYYLSTNAGKICPRSDVVAEGLRVIRLGIVEEDGVFRWQPDVLNVDIETSV